jgi:hypothetical protein
MTRKDYELNLIELIFLKSALENTIEELEKRGDFQTSEPLKDALAKVKIQREIILTNNWNEEKLA